MDICRYTRKTIASCPYTSVNDRAPFFMHEIEIFKISFVENGSCSYTFLYEDEMVERKIDVSVGSIYIVRPHEIHYCKEKTIDVRYRDIYVEPSVFKECCDFVEPGLYNSILNSKFPPVFKVTPVMLLYLSESCSYLVGKEISPDKDKVHKGLIINLLDRYVLNSIDKKIYPFWINELIRLLNKGDYVCKPIHEIVKDTNYSHGYVSREFKKYLGVKLKTYVNKKKFDYAAILLATTKEPLDIICYKLGFSTVSSFIYSFKKIFNMTPLQYRKSYSHNIDSDGFTEWN